MKQLAIILVFLIFSSCIPLRIAPNIDDYKIKVAKKFKRKLPKKNAFIFEDPKEADAFYNYINIKYNLNFKNVENNVPFAFNGKIYFLSFYEIEIPTKYFNFLPGMAEAAFEMVVLGADSYSSEVEMTRIGHWYLALTVSNFNKEDCLDPNYEFRAELINYLQDLKTEYLAMNTQNLKHP